MIKRIVGLFSTLFLIFAALSTSPSLAQSGCNGQFAAGTVCGNPTTTQSPPTQTPNPVLGSPGASVQGTITLTPGAGSPPSPINGELWTTSAGLFVQINGSTVGPIDPITYGFVNLNSFAGFDPTGASPQQSVFSEAFSAIPNGGTVYYCGTLLLTAPVNIPGNTTLQGCGKGAAIIFGGPGLTTLNLFQVGVSGGNPGQVNIRDTRFSYVTNQVATSAAIYVSNGHDISLRDIETDAGLGGSPYASVIFDGGSGQFNYSLTDFEFNNGTYGIIVGLLSQPADVWVSRGGISSMANVAIHVISVGGLYGNDVSVIASGTGMDLVPPSGSTIQAVKVKGYLLDTNKGNGLNICPTGSGVIANSTFTDLWSATNGTGGPSPSNSTGNGVYICNTGTTYNINFVGGEIVNNFANGISQAGGTQFSYAGVTVDQNSSSGSNIFSGYRMAASNWSITGGASGTSQTNLQKYGVEVLAGSFSDYAVIGVDLCGNDTGARIDGGTGGDSQWFGNLCDTQNTTTLPVVSTASGAGNTAAFQASAASPGFSWKVTGGAADDKYWDAYADVVTSTLNFRAVKDDQTSATAWLQVVRNGTTIVSVNYPTGLVQYFGPNVLFGINSGAPTHVGFAQSTKPTVTSCGTGAATTPSTDSSGQVAATGASACTVVFNVSYSTQPYCTATDNTTAAGLKIVYGGSANFTVSGLTSGDTFTYQCFGE